MFGNVNTLASLTIESDGTRNLVGLERLRTVTGDLRCFQSVLNGDITSLSGLQEVGGTFEWRSNQGQRLPAMLNLTAVGTLISQDLNFVAFGGFRALTTVGRLQLVNLGASSTSQFPVLRALPRGLVFDNVGNANVLPAHAPVCTRPVMGFRTHRSSNSSLLPGLARAKGPRRRLAMTART